MHESSAPSARTRVIRLPARGAYDRPTIDSILDQAPICHVGFVHGVAPVVVPTIHVRVGDELFVHGSAASRMLELGGSGAELCVTASLVDGFVFARSAFHHSMNYRSVIVFGRARVVNEPEEKARVLSALVGRFSPGRAELVRAPSELELKATRVLALPLAEASAKVRTGGPIDDEADLDIPVWAGVVPVALRALPPIAAERCSSGSAAPDLGLGLGVPRGVKP